MLKQGAASPPRWVCSRTYIRQREGLGCTSIWKEGRKEVPALLWTKQTNWKYLRGSKTQNNSTLRQKDLLKAHSRAPGCIGRHVHARAQFPAEQPEFFEEWFRQTGKLSMDLSPWRLHSIPGSTFRGPQTHTLSKRFNGMIQQLQESQSRRRRTANTVELIWD